MTSVTIALIGNPNCGKTTLFNNLTGAHQKVGNWPGVTVEKKSGTMMLGDQSVEIVDLPGIYSLEQDYLGLDEIIARDFLRQENYDLVINIIDATNLERNLVLTQQVLEASQNVIVALNMVDVAHQNGVEIDVVALSKKLGVIVVPIVASRGTGVDGLKFHMQESLTAGKKPETERSVEVSHDIHEATGDKLIRRYHTAKRLVDGVMLMTPVEHSLTEQIDRWVLNRWLGIPFFLFMMYAMFTVAISFGAVFIDFFDILFGAVSVCLCVPSHFAALCPRWNS